MKTYEPMFLNPVIRAKTYNVLDANSRIIGEVNADNASEAFNTAREMFGDRARMVAKKEAK